MTAVVAALVVAGLCCWGSYQLAGWAIATLGVAEMLRCFLGLSIGLAVSGGLVRFFVHLLRKRAQL